jgi:hypothetical protein
MLHYYDAVDYSLNAFNTPTVGYGGEIDAQLQASVNIREQLTAEGFRFQQDGPFRWVTSDLRTLFLIGPKTAHSWHPESRAESNVFIRKALETADRIPDRVRFVTYTTRFNKAWWLTVTGLDKTYTRAEVDATRSHGGETYTLTTKNVSRLELEASAGAFTIDGRTIKAGANPSFVKSGSEWTLASNTNSGSGRFTGCRDQSTTHSSTRSSVCVRPEPRGIQVSREWSAKTLEVFSTNFAKWLRGDVRVKDDARVEASDIADYNLILFGDPGSNSVIAKVIGQLPIRCRKPTSRLESTRSARPITSR